ncbi:DNA recombination protein RmuC [Neolewinella lacunae]|uniref:DNA recombination protein RmuC n=1 Tax=Neolewinella lacunae TaxID=1517758 RepID=A0A923PQ31_9BACT|nr:DNA recombination protein RmuC [Neolewinella lacunae]MBC6994657.1 DNA recombination protein RmuC [Neolewinella lacunae]MDN3634529.1 DNA recombination protein RmuC [Neolewinella lacunae]
MEASTVAILLLLSAVVGALLSWLVLQLRLRRDFLPLETLAKEYIRREIYEQLRQDADLHYENLQEKTAAEQALAAELAATRVRLEATHEKLNQQASEMQRLQAASLAQFEQTANRLLQEKSAHFSAQNAAQISSIIQPLRDHLAGFEQQVASRFLEETRDRISLRNEIQHLQQLNVQISNDANNLAGALRGNNKTQGDWGEWQLLTLLEASGLQAGLHFEVQQSYRDEDDRIKRPDFVINLPEGKHLVIDSKVSLTAYDRYCALDGNDPERPRQAKAHLGSLRQHILDLASKNYPQLYQISSPDYLLLFIPIEPAFGLALQTDRNLFTEALERNVVIVTPSTLLATLRTVNFIWKQDLQKKNVQEIARQSGLLYDGFVAFTEELANVGKQLDRAQAAYNNAIRKLSTGGKPGSTLIGRAERLRKLGAKNKKNLPQEFLALEEE